MANLHRVTNPALPFYGGLVGSLSSYGTAFLGGIVLCAMIYRRRRNLRREPVAAVNE